MPNREYKDKLQHRQNYRNLWHSDLMRTMQKDPPYCCLAFWCGPCVSYRLRKRAIYNDMSRYVCCAGNMSCSGRCGESRCPKFCLATEVFLCFGNSVASTRFLLRDEFDIQTTQCDNCIEEISEASHLLSSLADMVYCMVCTCMQTQHKIEMDKRDGKFGPQPTAVPPAQQMSRLDQPYPPTAGCAPTAGYPSPANGQSYYPPPPQAHGYPPQASGYPPSGYLPVGYPQK